MKNIMKRTTKFKLFISILVLILNIGIVSNVFATQTRSPKMLGTATYNGQELSGSNDTMTYEQTETAKALIINAQFSSASVPKKIEVDIVPGFEYKTIPGMVKTGETWTFDASKLMTQEAMIISKVEFVPGTPFYNNIPRHGKVIITLKNDATSANIELGINRDNQYYYGSSNITDTYADAISAKVFENNIQKDYEKLETLNITRATGSYSIFSLLNNNLLSTGDSYTTNYNFSSTINNNGFPVTNIKKIDLVVKVNKKFGVNNIAITGSSNLTYTKVTGSDSNFDYFNILIDNYNPSSRINLSGEIIEGLTPGNYAFMTAESFKSYDVNDKLLADRSAQVFQSSSIFAIAKETDNKLEYRNYGMPSNNSNRIAEEEIDIYNDLNKSMYLGAFEMSNSSKVDIVDQKMEISFDDPSYQIKAVKLLNIDGDVSKNIVVKTNKTTYNIPSLVGVYANANISLAKLGSTDSSEYIEKVTYEYGKVKSGFESRVGDYYIGGANHKVVEYYGNIINKPADNKLKVSVISVDKSLDFSDNSASTFTSITDIMPLGRATITTDSNLTGTYLSNSTVTSTHSFFTNNYMPMSPRSQMIKGYNIYLSDKSGELEALKNTIKLTEQDGTVYSVADGSLVPIEMVDNLGNKVIKISMPNNYIGRIYDQSTGYSLFGLKNVTVDYKVPATAKTQTIKTASNISIVPSNPATAARVVADTATINYVQKDTTNLTGNTNQLLETVSPFKTYTIKADKAFVVGSSANLNNGPWTSYDYDTNATILNLNPVGQAKYRLNISNNSGSTIEGYTALIPIPKYGEKTARTPITPDLFDKREHLQKEAFGWTIAVNNPIVVPNSTVLYADTYELDKDSTNFKPWSSFANKDEIRMIKVTSNTSMPNEYSEEFNFPLDLSDPAADAHAGNSNTYSSLIHRVIDGNAGYSPSEPVSIRLKTGILNGKVMLDKDASNTNNTGDTPLVGVSVIARNKVTQAIEDTTVTNDNGEYTFLGLEKTQKIDVEIVNPSVEQYKFNSKVAGGSDAEALADQTKASIKDLTPSTDINKLVLLMQSVTVTYNSQGGVASKASEKAFPTDQLTMPTVDERTGYTFNGWYSAASGGTKVTGAYTTPATNVTLYAQWTANTYNFKYNNQGTETNHSVVYNTSIPVAPTAIKAGYTFNGWYTAASGGTSVDTTTAKMPANDWTLYAQFTADNQTITFDTAGGSTAPSNIVQATDSTVDLSTISEPTRAGYSFDGWYVGATKYSGTINMPVGGLNLIAKWVAEDQTITFDAKGGTPVPTTITLPTGTAVNLAALTNPVKAGYSFDGWYVGTTKHSGIISMPAGGLALEAKYTALGQVITFDAKGGTPTPADISLLTDASIDLSTVVSPTKAGYQFLGWFNGTTQYSGIITMPATGLALEANWQATNQTISFDADGGTPVPSNITKVTGDSVDLTAITQPTKAGYSFDGWYVGTTQYSGSIAMPAGGLTLKAVYTALDQTIAFDAKGGTPTPANIIQPTNTTVNLAALTSPTKAGYIFDGWYVDTTKYSGSITMPAGGLLLEAKYTASNQTITFDAKGGAPVPANIVQPTDSSVDFDAVVKPVREGYTFKGWFLNNTEYTGVITMPVGGLNLVAHYETEKFTGHQLTSPIKDLSKINSSYLISKVDPKAWLEDGEGVKIKDCIISNVDFSALKDKVGSYPIIFTTDSGETHTIYYSVGKTKSPVTNDKHALDASDFTMELDEFKDAVKSGTIKEKVINASSAKAWEIKTNKEVKGLDYKLTSTKDITKVGKYGVSFTTTDLAAQAKSVGKKATALNNNVTLTIVNKVTPIDPLLPKTGLDYMMYSLIAGIIGLTTYGFKAINRKKD